MVLRNFDTDVAFEINQPYPMLPQITKTHWVLIRLHFAVNLVAYVPFWAWFAAITRYGTCSRLCDHDHRQSWVPSLSSTIGYSQPQMSPCSYRRLHMHTNRSLRELWDVVVGVWAAVLLAWGGQPKTTRKLK